MVRTHQLRRLLLRTYEQIAGKSGDSRPQKRKHKSRKARLARLYNIKACSSDLAERYKTKSEKNVTFKRARGRRCREKALGVN